MIDKLKAELVDKEVELALIEAKLDKLWDEAEVDELPDIHQLEKEATAIEWRIEQIEADIDDLLYSQE